MPHQHAIAKAGRETFNLVFHRLGEIARGTNGGVAISPESLFALGRAGLVKKTLLRDQNEWALRIMAARDFAFAEGDLVQGSAKMKGSGTTAFGCPPRHCFGERIVDLKDCRSMPKTAESRTISRG